MSVPVIVFISIYCVVLCCYFYTETTGNLKLRAPNKCILALMFFIFAIIAFTTSKKYSFNSYHALLMVALFLAMLGDIFLLFDLNRGGDFFLAGNVCFATYYMALLNDNKIYFDSYWWVILIVAVIIIGIWLIARFFPNFLKFSKKMKYPMLFYLTTITLHGTLGIVTICFLGNKGLQFLLLGAGSILFMISDYVLTTDKFILLEKNKWCLRLNSLTYFVGLLLIVLSMIY